MENEVSMCHSYSIKEDDPGDKSHGKAGRQEPHSHSEGTVSQYLNKKSRVDLVRVTRLIQDSRSLGACRVTRQGKCLRLRQEVKAEGEVHSQTAMTAGSKARD